MSGLGRRSQTVVETINDILREGLTTAEAAGAAEVEIGAADLLEAAWKGSLSNDRLKWCCDAMYSEFGSGDQILRQPPSGYGRTLRIRFKLPRE